MRQHAVAWTALSLSGVHQGNLDGWATQRTIISWDTVQYSRLH